MAEKEAENEVEGPASGAQSAPLIESLDIEHLREIIQLCRENDIAELTIEHKGTRIHIKGHGAAAPVEYARPPAVPVPLPVAAPVAAPAVTTPAAEGAAPPKAGEISEEANYVVIRSPMVGTFYRAPAPDAPSFVEVGDKVQESTLLCIVEAMKLMNEIKAETRGTMVKVLVENAQPVEFNQPMFYIKPE